MKIRILLFTMLALAVAAGAYAHRGGGCPGQRGHAAKDCSSPKECLDQARCGGQNGHGGHYQGFMADLTPEQQEKVRKATDKHHEELPSTKLQQGIFLSEILRAHSIQKDRYKCSYKYNNDITGSSVDKLTSISTPAKSFSIEASKKLGLSARSYFKVIKVARTIADLDPHLFSPARFRLRW